MLPKGPEGGDWAMNVTLPITSRAALYLRVSTTRQADVDLSIPDQRLQTAAYCERQG